MQWVWKESQGLDLLIEIAESRPGFSESLDCFYHACRSEDRAETSENDFWWLWGKKEFLNFLPLLLLGDIGSSLLGSHGFPCSYCYIISFHQLSLVKPYLFLHSVGQKPSTAPCVLWVHHKVKPDTGQQGLLPGDCSQDPSDCWQNSVLCDCRTESMFPHRLN